MVNANRRSILSRLIPATGTAVKRLVDLLLSTVILVFMVPVFALIAFTVLICDGRPVFFRQERVGRRGKPFTMLKFRTMVCGAEGMLGQLKVRNERNGPLFKMTHDPRVTKLGRLLRDSSIDELPQLLNVVRGEMSLVGPRPALRVETEAFAADFVQARQSVRPGITGLWQIGAREDPGFGEYERLDRVYVERRSLRLDLGILLLTVPMVLTRPWGRLCGRRGPMLQTGAGVRYLPSHSTAWYTHSLTRAQPLTLTVSSLDDEA